ncbi:hypothetical protein [Paraburkholderia elongata]|uniref:Uncharacterized protein n=1 Tax=Paraburkholderia elongata TaxID=2675747 RepID=A0A972NJT9_9BURK|nr:hypothetical protein [Paraburkholderia elongata]NPT54738.1 hypothetical protein [Paraburkholderia elongata]
MTKIPDDIVEWLESTQPRQRDRSYLTCVEQYQKNTKIEFGSPRYYRFRKIKDSLWFYDGQMHKARMLEQSIDPGVAGAWADIRAALRPPLKMVEFFLSLPEDLSRDPHQRAFGRSRPLDVKAARKKQQQYRTAAETLRELIDDERACGGMLLAAQINDDAREHVIPVSVALDDLRIVLPHLIQMLAKVDPGDQLPSAQPGAGDVNRQNYRALVAESCVRYFDSVPYTAVAIVANAIAGECEDDEDAVTVEGLRKLVERRRTKS